MDKRKKIKVITTIICLLLSIFALYTFIFVFTNGVGWKAFLIIVGICWLLSAISGFINNLNNKNK